MASPIETSLFEALSEHIDHGAAQGEHVLVWPALYIDFKAELKGRHLVDSEGRVGKLNRRHGVMVGRQVRIRGYFADILLWSPDHALAIECDGHDWHERTRQQAAADRARDRELLRHGVTTIRFTGSEIHRDANQCALEVVETWKAIDERISDAVEQVRADAFGAGINTGEQLYRNHIKKRELDKGPAWLRDLVATRAKAEDL